MASWNRDAEETPKDMLKAFTFEIYSQRKDQDVNADDDLVFDDVFGALDALDAM